jgi:carboxymethylenebutenolidase
VELVSVVVEDVQGAPFSGYIGVPDAGIGPGVLAIQEWGGLVPHITSIVERLAEAGFVALAVDHYRGVETSEPDEAQKLMMGLRITAVAADIAAGAEYLLALKELSSESVGSIGFCMGGGLSLLAPTVGAVSSAVALYPTMPWPDSHPDWSNCASKAALIHKAESDETHAGPRIDEYADAIREAGGEISIFDHPGSQHAFFNDDRPEVFDPEHAATGWQCSVEFLDARLR